MVCLECPRDEERCSEDVFQSTGCHGLRRKGGLKGHSVVLVQTVAQMMLPFIEMGTDEEGKVKQQYRKLGW